MSTFNATSFDPNAASSEDSGIFGLPHSEEQASLIYIPVPWEATTSYGGGTSQGPSAILGASRQVDLFDLDVEKPYEAGLHLLEESPEVQAWNKEAKELAQAVIHDPRGAQAPSQLKRVNEFSHRLNQWVHQETLRILSSGKIAAIVGGDHSVPLGALQALSESEPSFGILHFDAHSDTRNAYEGFTYSHASIMRNVLDQIPAVKKLVQVGIRDLCEEEHDYVSAQKDRAFVFYDRTLKIRQMEGAPWMKLCQEIIAQLPKKVWISFDIDGLDPRYCPHTGTPVPGGLELHEAYAILSTLVKSGRTILGFDLNEVSPGDSSRSGAPDSAGEWDANVGARLLYKLSAWTLASRKKALIREA